MTGRKGQLFPFEKEAQPAQDKGPDYQTDRQMNHGGMDWMAVSPVSQ